MVVLLRGTRKPAPLRSGQKEEVSPMVLKKEAVQETLRTSASRL